MSRASTSPGPEFSPPPRKARAWLPAQLCRQHQPDLIAWGSLSSRALQIVCAQ